MDISQSKVDVPCPKCEADINVSLKKIEQQETVTCTACSSKIDLVDKDGSSKKVVRDVNKSLKSLTDTIKKFGKQFYS